MIQAIINTVNKHVFKLILVLTVSIIGLGLNSCTERIDIDTGTTYTRLAIQGQITPFEGKQYVRLTKTSDYFSNEPPEAVSGAVVNIDDGMNIIQFYEDTTNPGYYISPTDYIGHPGIEYRMYVELSEEINGSKNYFAQELMPIPAEKIDSIALEYNDRWEMWMVKLYALEPPTKDFYMFDGYVNGKIITDSVANKNISDDRLFNGSNTAGTIVMVVDGEQLFPGDTFTLSLSNISEAYANYMMELQQEIQPNDPMFSGPPANVSSNVNNDAVGYFAAYPSIFASKIAEEPIE